MLSLFSMQSETKTNQSGSLPTIFVLSDANRQSGLGHYLRCLSLSKALDVLSYKTIFLGDFNALAKQFAVYFGQVLLDNVTDIVSRVKTLPLGSFVLIDSYHYCPTQLPEGYHYVLIDDFCFHPFYPVAGVLNFTYEAKGFNYLFKGAKRQALGIDYYLPHPSLVDLNLSPIKQIQRILIMIGSGDQNNLSSRIFGLLKSINPLLDIKIVATDISRYKDLPPEVFLSPIPDVSQFYAWADFYITSGGLAKYESAFLGRPAAVLPLTPEESLETVQFERAGLCFNLGPLLDDEVALTKYLRLLLTTNKPHQLAHKNTQRVFTAHSADNAAEFIVDCFREIQDGNRLSS